MEFEAFKSSLIEKLEMINVKIDEHQAKHFYDYMNLLIEWNEKINLTAITKPEEIILKHFVDSLTIANEIKETNSFVEEKRKRPDTELLNTYQTLISLGLTPEKIKESDLEVYECAKRNGFA